VISDERFAKREHLLKTKDFRAVYKKGRSSKKDSVIFYWLRNELTHGRIGFSISSRNVKRASSRNRIRRLFREAYRKNKKALKCGFDIIIIVRKELVKRGSYKDVEKVFLKLADSAGILAWKKQ